MLDDNIFVDFFESDFYNKDEVIEELTPEEEEEKRKEEERKRLEAQIITINTNKEPMQAASGTENKNVPEKSKSNKATPKLAPELIPNT